MIYEERIKNPRCLFEPKGLQFILNHLGVQSVEGLPGFIRILRRQQGLKNYLQLQLLLTLQVLFTHQIKIKGGKEV